MLRNPYILPVLTGPSHMPSNVRRLIAAALVAFVAPVGAQEAPNPAPNWDVTLAVPNGRSGGAALRTAARHV